MWLRSGKEHWVEIVAIKIRQRTFYIAGHNYTSIIEHNENDKKDEEHDENEENKEDEENEEDKEEKRKRGRKEKKKDKVKGGN